MTLTRGTSPSASRLPNLFLIGAPKSGTTSLHRILAQHPDIFMSRVKEPAFFSSHRRSAFGLDWYADEFFQGSDGYPIRGESTPWYLYSRLAIEQIEQYLPVRPRFLVVLRDPVARAYSQYWDQVAAAREQRSFEQAVQDDPASPSEFADLDEIPDPRLVTAYITAGRYSEFLAGWFDRFGRERFCVLIQEELRDDAGAQLEKLWRFLGVTAPPAAELPHANQSSVPVSRTFERVFRSLERLPVGFRHAIARGIGYERLRRLDQRLVRANRRPGEYPPINTATAASLHSRFEDEIGRLEALLGRSLDAWTTIPEPYQGTSA